MGEDKTGLVLLVHGSRDKAWMRPFEELARDVEHAAKRPVRLACLQYCKPGLGEAVGKLAGEGVSRVLVVPFFISALGHVLRDVPKEIEAAARKFPGLEIHVLPAVGEMESVKTAFREALLEVLGQK